MKRVLVIVWTSALVSLWLSHAAELRAQGLLFPTGVDSILAAEPEPFVVLPAGFEEVVEEAGGTEPRTHGAVPSGPVPANGTVLLRDQLRASLRAEGEKSEAEHDRLSRDVASLAKWTCVIVTLAGASLFALKKFGWRPAPPPSSGGALQIIDTLKLGRHQGLHLVEVAGERLVVASDPGGIRSVTLLPAWPGDEAVDEPSPNMAPSIPFQKSRSTV